MCRSQLLCKVEQSFNHLFTCLPVMLRDSARTASDVKRELSVSPFSCPIEQLVEVESVESVESVAMNSAGIESVLVKSNHSEPQVLQIESRYHELPEFLSPKVSVVKAKSISAPIGYGCSDSPKTRFIRSQSFTSRPDGTEISNLNKFTKNYLLPAAKWAYIPISNKKKLPDNCPYKIEYSVFKPATGYKKIESEKDMIILWKHINQTNQYSRIDLPENWISLSEFNSLVDTMIDLIENEAIYPKRVAQGSSGSYFIQGKKKNSNIIEIIGIFKPKDEEPYGSLSPKWGKWIHRTCFPCFFGRSCLIPNLGYISEVAASVLDRQLLSYIVPYTDIIYLKSPTFHYSFLDQFEGSENLPYKIGSFQLFLNGYLNANEWLRIHPLPRDILDLPDHLHIVVDLQERNLDIKFLWSKETLQQFREELEKLVILDYIMRNTDRGLDNWMIKIEWNLILENKDTKTLQPWIKIGAIDSGLAFPWKRPDEWRSFPFGWLFLPLAMIGQPFSENTRKHYLPLLTSVFWWEQTVPRLREVFVKDKEFKESKWAQQLAVLKGQAFNVVEILKLSYAGPLELVRREDLWVWDDVMDNPNLDHVNTETNIEWDENSPLVDNNRDTGNETRRDVDISGYERINQPEFANFWAKDNQKVIIERLEKADSKPPVFTWC